MSMHPGHAGRRTSEILRLKRRPKPNGPTLPEASEAVRGADIEAKTDRPTGAVRVVWALFGLLADPNSQGASNPQPTKHKRA